MLDFSTETRPSLSTGDQVENYLNLRTQFTLRLIRSLQANDGEWMQIKEKAEAAGIKRADSWSILGLATNIVRGRHELPDGWAEALESLDRKSSRDDEETPFF